MWDWLDKPGKALEMVWIINMFMHIYSNVSILSKCIPFVQINSLKYICSGYLHSNVHLPTPSVNASCTLHWVKMSKLTEIQNPEI